MQHPGCFCSECQALKQAVNLLNHLSPWPSHATSWLTGKVPEGLGAGEGDDRGWDGWMASSTRCTWVYVNSGSWWWTGRPGVLRFMWSQSVGYDWATELNWKHQSVSFIQRARNFTRFKFSVLFFFLPIVSTFWIIVKSQWIVYTVGVPWSPRL